MHRKSVPETGSIGSSNFLATSLIRNALQRSEHIAISTMEQSVTYSELLHRVSTLADSLPMTSNGPDGMRPVGVVVDRSISSVVAIMAVRWAGLPVMPIAQCEPVDRLAQVFEQTQPQIVIDATGNMRSRLVGREVIAPEHPTSTTCRIPGNRTAADEIAMILFTSGSTGEPKLLARSNRVATKTWNNWDHPRLLGNWNHAISFSPLNFAGGYLFGITMPAKGKQVTLLDIESPDIGKLADYCESHRVDCIAATPSLIQTIHTIFGNRRLSSIKRVITFGEGLDWSVVSKIRKLFSEEVTVQSIYGASETAGVIAEHTISPQDPIGIGITPLGTPIDAQHIRLEPLEGSDKLFELVVVDNSVDRYHFSASQTDCRFTTTAHGTVQWNSQDVVSRDEKGILHFKGRLDDMIKINGVLVEPAEVESVLTSLPGVQRAVVLAQKNQTSQLSLVAHLMVDDGVSLDRIKSSLNKRLPRVLVPSDFVKHAEMPMTQRGKVDRARLRSDSFERWRSQDDCDSKQLPLPNTTGATIELDGIRKKLQRIWSEVLNQEAISENVPFAELGGDSLLAVILLSRIERDFQRTCTPTDLQNNSTIEKLAQWLLKPYKSSQFIEPYDYSTHGQDRPIFVLPSIEGVCSLPNNLMNAMHGARPMVVLRKHLPKIPDQSCRDFAELATQFVHAIRKYQPTGPYILIGYCYGGTLAFEIARQLEALNQKIALLAVIDAGQDPKMNPFSAIELFQFSSRFVWNLPKWIESTHQSRKWSSTAAKGMSKFWNAVTMSRSRPSSNQTTNDHRRPKRFHRFDEQTYGTILKLFKAYQAYQPGKFLGRIVLYRANSRPLLHSLSPSCGWSSIASDLVIVSIPGDHESMLTGDGFAILSQDLRRRIMELRPVESSGKVKSDEADNRTEDR